MKKLKLCLLCLLTGSITMFVNAQSADDVIGKYITALGGAEKLKSLNTLKLTGTLSVQGNDVSIVITRKHMVGSRADFSIMGTENYQVLNTEKGWSFMPVQGMTEPAEMPADQFKTLQIQLDIQSPLLNYKDKGNQVELQRNEKINGEDCFNIKLTYKNGLPANIFISSKDYRIVKTTGKRAINGQDIDVETTYSNYKQNTDGYWFAYTVSSNVQGETNFEKVETNIPVDDKIFKSN